MNNEITRLQKLAGIIKENKEFQKGDLLYHSTDLRNVITIFKRWKIN